MNFTSSYSARYKCSPWQPRNERGPNSHSSVHWPYTDSVKLYSITGASLYISQNDYKNCFLFFFLRCIYVYIYNNSTPNIYKLTFLSLSLSFKCVLMFWIYSICNRHLQKYCGHHPNLNNSNSFELHFFKLVFCFCSSFVSFVLLNTIKQNSKKKRS